MNLRDNLESLIPFRIFIINKKIMDNFNLKKFLRNQYLSEGKDINEAENGINLSLTQGELNTLKEALDCLADFHNMAHEENEEMAMNYRSLLAKLDGSGINENDDVQAKVNAKSKVQSKGGDEKNQARKGYGDKPNKSGEGKAVKRRMNKRNRKDAKQALKDA